MFDGSQASVQPRVDINHHPPSNQHLVAASILLQAHQGHPHGHHPVVQQQPPPLPPQPARHEHGQYGKLFLR